MTRSEIIHEIEQLEEKADVAAEYGDTIRKHEYMRKMAELEGTLSAMGGE